MCVLCSQIKTITHWHLICSRRAQQCMLHENSVKAPFDSKWVPPVGGAPSRHTGTGGATAGVHAQCLRDPGAGDTSLVVPRAAARQSLVVPREAARRSQVVPQSKQLGSQTRRCRAEQAAGTGSQPRRCAGRSAGAHRRGEEKGPRRIYEVSGFEASICVLRVFFLQSSF